MELFTAHFTTCSCYILFFRGEKNITSSVYDCTVEDVEYIYNKLSIHIFNNKSRLSVL